MYEAYTYDAILADALSRVTSDVDKREGSVIYDALAPACLKLAEYYSLLDGFIDLVMPDTAVDEYLDRVASSKNITRKPATAAVRKVTTSEALDIGSRWNLDIGTTVTVWDSSGNQYQTTSLVYSVTALISTGVYSVTCESCGAAGNAYTGQLSNIDNTSDATVMLTDIVSSGTDMETDDALRARYYAKVRNPATSGNKAAYKQWATETDGCGGAKVFAAGDNDGTQIIPKGTVEMLVVDDNMAIDTTLPTKVFNYITKPDDPENQLNPLDATLIVINPTGLEINVASNVKLDGSQTLAQVEAAFSAALTEYLKSEVFTTYSVGYAKIGSILLSVPGVSDYNTLTVNGGTANITIPLSDIPIAGTVDLTEV